MIPAKILSSPLVPSISLNRLIRLEIYFSKVCVFTLFNLSY